MGLRCQEHWLALIRIGWGNVVAQRSKYWPTSLKDESLWDRILPGDEAFSPTFLQKCGVPLIRGFKEVRLNV